MKKQSIYKAIPLITGALLLSPILITHPETTTESIKKNISDSYITSKVKSKLALNTVTKARNIKVITEKGVVFLSGDVDSSNEALTAVEVAASVEGVRDINSEKLSLPSSLTPTDDLYLASKIKGFLLREKLFNNFSTPEIQMQVTSIDGDVTLSGKVNSLEQKNKAIEIALKTKGVKKVTSNLAISNNK